MFGTKKLIIISIVSLFLPFVMIAASLFVGRYHLNAEDVLAIFFTPNVWLQKSGDMVAYSVVHDVRLPRAVLAVLVGAALAVSGGALQGVFRNPLVDSGMLGVSVGAGFGACLGILLFGNSVFVYVLSFTFGVAAMLLSLMVARVYNSAPTVTLVLGGVVVSSVFSALISFIKYIADPMEKLPVITFWLMGSMSRASFDDMRIAIIPIGIGIIGLLLVRWRINVLSLGDKDAIALGVNTRVCRIWVIFCTSIATAGAVCLSGTISWIGLIIPHIVRMLVGNDNRVLLPICLSFGGSFLLFVDMLARSLTGSEIPLGVLTALIGGPFFVFILKQTKGEGSW